jgi:hypothetical protein
MYTYAAGASNLHIIVTWNSYPPHSLRVVEAFFGADVSSKMVNAAAQLSKKQTDELEGHIRYNIAISDE